MKNNWHNSFELADQYKKETLPEIHQIFVEEH